MKLEEFFPEKPTFTLKATGKTYELRLVNLHDHVFFKSAFGGEAGVQAAFSTMDWAAICKIAYRLMTDRSDFLAHDVEEIDDNGEQRKIRVSGPDALLKCVTLDDAVKMVDAIVTSFKLSNPAVAQAMDDSKKKEVLVESKTGDQSMTPLPQSTDSPLAHLAN